MDTMDFNNTNENNEINSNETNNNVTENSATNGNVIDNTAINIASDNVNVLEESTENSGSFNSSASQEASPAAPSLYNEMPAGKRNKKPVGLSQLILVAILSAIFGGGVVGVLIGIVIPAVNPALGKVIQGSEGIFGSSNSQAEVRKVEIVEQSDSVISTISEKVSPSVVGIKVIPGTAQSSSDLSSFFYGNSQSSTSEGSGIIISSDGYIVTNNHVIENALDSSGQLSKSAKLEVYLQNQLDKPYTAQVIGWDKKTDLALLKIDAQNLTAAEFGDSDKLKVGELAVAIGNPGGLEYMGSVTAGIVSGLNRQVQTEDGKDIRYIQTDAAINPGNSGGALVNSKGQVVGINTVKVFGDGFEGLGFAVPSNTVKEIVDSLKNNTFIKGRAPVLGISVAREYTDAIAKRYGWPMGIYVASVTQFSGAYRAGIQANDIITKFDGEEVKDFDKLNEIKNKHNPGDTVDVEIYRDKNYSTVKVTLTEDRG